MKKQYNTATGYYKIDIMTKDDVYICSTDNHKTCRSAKESYLKNNPKAKPEDIKARFSRK